MAQQGLLLLLLLLLLLQGQFVANGNRKWRSSLLLD
jgi:hypothetical protein